jgi:hypothetical protein
MLRAALHIALARIRATAQTPHQRSVWTSEWSRYYHHSEFRNVQRGQGING